MKNYLHIFTACLFRNDLLEMQEISRRASEKDAELQGLENRNAKLLNSLTETKLAHSRLKSRNAYLETENEKVRLRLWGKLLATPERVAILLGIFYSAAFTLVFFTHN